MLLTFALTICACNYFNCFMSVRIVSQEVTTWHLCTRLFWNSPGKNTRVSSHSLLQGIFPTQGSNPGLLHCRQILYQLSHQGRIKNKKQMCASQQLFHSIHGAPPVHFSLSLSSLWESLLTWKLPSCPSPNTSCSTWGPETG